MEYLHPSVSSKIVDNSITFVSAQGVTNLFCAFTADKGPDNRIIPITSPSEFIFNYGTPNMRKHGQATYNILNWLNAHGGLFALRVMPENAGYSHAVVNVQTKLGTKRVKHADGVTLVEVPDVAVRTVVAHTPVNNISEEALIAELDKVDREKTIDGFDNHWLVAFYPKGRGKYYDRLGFSLKLNNSYDETYAFRLYNFEVTQTNEAGSVEVIEGPFLVSLDPDAISKSNESMFIKYVVEKYSIYYNVLFNESVYDALGEVINPNVNPNSLDFFHGSTRLIGGQVETYYEPITGKTEDVHLSVQKYDANGVRLAGATNYVDATSAIEGSVVDMDNSARASVYNGKLVVVDRRKEVLDAVRKSTFTTYTEQLAKFTTSNGIHTLTDGDLKDSTDAVTAAQGAFSSALTAYSSPTDANLTALETASRDYISKVSSLVYDFQKGVDICSAVAVDVNVASAIAEIASAEGTINLYNVLATKSVGKIAALSAAKLALPVAVTNADKIAAVKNILAVATDAYQFAVALDIPGRNEANVSLTTLATSLTNVSNALVAAEDPNTLTQAVIDTAVSNAVTLTSTLVDDAKQTVRLAVLELAIDDVNALQGNVSNGTKAVLDSINATRTSVLAGPQNTVIATVVASIDAARAEASATASITYTLKLRAFDTVISLAFGTDGDLTDGLPQRSTTIKNLLIQAYTGAIDDRIVNKKEIPIDMVLDANYDSEVKNAIVSLATELRADFLGILDTKFTANPDQAIKFRENELQVSSYLIAIFTQDFVVYDEYTGKDMKVTSPYFLSGKIPANDEQFGIHFPFAGPRRGTISGFKKLSWNPTEPWKESLYKKQINYIEQDPRRTKFATQLTSQTVVSALSDINNVRALLQMKRDVENLAEDYQMEFGDGLTLQSFQFNLDGTLQKWISNRACTSIKGTVYQSDYDKKQKTARVKIEVVFNSVIERILIDFVVGR